MNLYDSLYEYANDKHEEGLEIWDFVQQDAATPVQGSLFCQHSWKPTLLIFTTVWDCNVCGRKKEDVEAAEKLDRTMW